MIFFLKIIVIDFDSVFFVQDMFADFLEKNQIKTLNRKFV